MALAIRLFKGICSAPASSTTIGAPTTGRGRVFSSAADLQAVGIASAKYGALSTSKPRLPNSLSTTARSGFKGLRSAPATSWLIGKPATSHGVSSFSITARKNYGATFGISIPEIIAYRVPVHRTTYSGTSFLQVPSDNTSPKYSGPQDVNLWSSPRPVPFYTEGRMDFCGLPMLLGGFTSAAGNPSPCLQIPAGSVWKTRRLIPVGARTISIDVQQLGEWFTSHPPKLIVRQNGRIGMTADLVATATLTNSWQTLGPLSFTATDDGGVTIEVHNPESDPRAILFIDNLNVT